MKTTISTKNPFGPNRYGFLWEALHELDKGRHLDYGAYDGAVIAALARTGVVAQSTGVDVNAGVVNRSRPAMPTNAELRLIDKGMLPFGDDHFDSVSILDVVEHIVDQCSLLKELNRVLKPGGSIIVTVPKRHAFSFLDMGNFKFHFPRLHRAFYSLRHSPEEYRSRYVECENGLFGDLEKGKDCHQHFSEEELKYLVEACGFRVSRFDGAGFFERPLSMIRYFLPGPLKRPLNWLIKADSRLFDKTHLFCLAKKA